MSDIDSHEEMVIAGRRAGLPQDVALCADRPHTNMKMK